MLCLDADDKLTPPFLERCVAALDAHPAAGIAYTDQQDFGASDKHHSVPEYDFHTLTRRNFFGIASVFRRQAWDEVGGFDPSTPYEDWNFWIACGVLGYHGIKVHGVEWLYRVRDNGRFKTYAASAIAAPRRGSSRAVPVCTRPSSSSGPSWCCPTTPPPIRSRTRSA